MPAPAELVALREAVEAAGRKGENVEGIRRELDAVEKAMTPATKLLWLETPSNPMLLVLDLERLCSLAKRKGVAATRRLKAACSKVAA